MVQLKSTSVVIWVVAVALATAVIAAQPAKPGGNDATVRGPVLATASDTPVVIATTSPLPDATEGVAYSLQFTASGGAGGYVWSSSASIIAPCPFPGCPQATGLPPGLSLSDTGLLQGTPTASGDFTAWIIVSDNAGAETFSWFGLHVNPSVVSTFSTWVPAASHTHGLNGSQWRTDVAILNASASAANIEFDFHGGGGVVRGTATVQPGAMSTLVDVVGEIGASGSGALELFSDQQLRVTSRTYNQISSDVACYPEGTQGQDYPAIVATDGLAVGDSAYLVGLAESPSRRSNVAVVNLGSDSATVAVELHDGTGTLLATYWEILAAGELAQETQPFKNLAGQAAMDRGYARITVSSGSGVFAFASVIDNVTNDPTTVAMQR